MSDGATRLDAWVWAVRMAKTRSAATEAVKAGRVRLNGDAAKPSRLEVEVLELRSKRVGAPLAEASYRVLSEDRPERAGPVAAWAQRDRGSGRPTKRDRRQLERWRHEIGDA